MRARHRRLDVNGVIAEAPQLQRFIEGAHHKQGIMAVCKSAEWKPLCSEIRWGRRVDFRVFHPKCFSAGRAEDGGPLTSAGVEQLGPLDEAQVAGPGPQRLGVPEAQFGVEVVGLQTLLPVDGVVAAGVVRTAHPDLKTKAAQRNSTLWVLKGPRRQRRP